jgi:hypothetical protein
MSADRSGSTRSAEELLMKALKYSSGLDREKLSELVQLATKLLVEVRQGSQQQPSSSSSSSRAPTPTTLGYEWWWIYGVPVIDTIGVEAVLKHEEVERLITAIQKMPDVRDVIGPVVLTPGSRVQGPFPEPWKLRTSFGAQKGPGPPNAWITGFAERS